jgi:hypothetical protein
MAINPVQPRRGGRIALRARSAGILRYNTHIESGENTPLSAGEDRGAVIGGRVISLDSDRFPPRLPSRRAGYGRVSATRPEHRLQASCLTLAVPP